MWALPGLAEGQIPVVICSLAIVHLYVQSLPKNSPETEQPISLQASFFPLLCFQQTCRSGGPRSLVMGDSMVFWRVSWKEERELSRIAVVKLLSFPLLII